MTRFIYDQFSKDYLETLLTPYGTVEVAKQIPGEIREIDLYFIPNNSTLPTELGILSHLATTPSLFEPYRNPVTPKEINDCLLKLLSVNAQIIREAKRNKSKITDTQLAKLWIITPTASRKILGEFGTPLATTWGEGIYSAPKLFKTGIIVVHQLPVTRETLWLRLLGRGKVQQQAIDELLALPDNYPIKSTTLEILYTLQRNLEVNRETTQKEDRELIMRLAPLYQEEKARAREEGLQQGIQQGLQQEAINLTLRILNRKFGNLSPEITNKIQQLNLEKIETLAEMLLDFNNLEDLETWLRDNSN